MTQRLLLFDSSCSTCTSIADSIQEVSDGWIDIKSLHNSEIKEILNDVKPNWRFEPSILEITDNKTKIFTGIRMQIYIFKGLGVRKSFKIAKILRRTNMSNVETSTKDRRTFLKRGSVFFGGILLSPLLTSLLPNKFIDRAFAANNEEIDSEHWTEKIKIKESQELKSTNYTPYLDKLKKELGLEKTNFKSDNIVAVHHSLEGNNNLIAIAAQQGSVLAVSYSLTRPLNNFRSGSFLYTLDEINRKSILETEIVNGQPSKDLSLESECGNCTIENFSYSINSSDAGIFCAEWDWDCVLKCCGPCAITCIPPATPQCIACVLAWCVACGNTCCTTPSPPRCYSCA